MLPSTTRKVAVIIGALLVLLLLIGASTVYSAWNTRVAARQLARSREVRTAVATVFAGVFQAETGAQAHIVTGDTAYLADLRTGFRRADSSLAHVRSLIDDEPRQYRRLDALASLLADRRAALEAAIREELPGSPVRPEYAREAAQAREQMVRLTALLDSVDSAESQRLANREQEEAQTSQRTNLLILVLMVLAAALGAFAIRSVHRDLLGRRRAEQELRSGEERFHAIFDQTFQLTALLALDGTVVEMNETALVFVEARREDVVGRAFSELPWWYDSGRTLVREAIAGAARGVFVRSEAQIRAPRSGLAASLDLSFKPMRDASGAVTMLIAEGRDITQRVLAESALRASEARFAGILALAAEAIITLDGDQRILHFNTGAERVFGHSAEEMMGQTLDRLLPVRSKGVHSGLVRDFGASGEGPRSMGRGRQIFGLHRDGHEFPIEGSISTTLVDGERLYTVVLRDVTDSRQTELRQAFLAEAGASLAATLEYEPTLEHVVRLAVPVLGELCVMDLDVGVDGPRSVVAHQDPELEEVMRTIRRRYPPPWDGPHPAAVARRSRTAFLMQELDPEVRSSIILDTEHEALFSRLSLRSALFVPLIARENVMGVLSSYSSSRALTDADLELAQELARRAAMAIDNAQSYRAARRASLARDEVLGVVSHDLRNPLSAIIMCGEALITERDPDELAHVGDVIRSSARWMQHLIRDLLDVTAIEAGALKANIEPTTAAAVIESLMAIHAGAARENEVTIQASIAEGVEQFEADPDRIIQALGNLLANAIRFSPAGAQVTLAATMHGSTGVAFHVSDRGPGIAPEQLPHLFDRFWQGPDGRRGGIGLGLPIARGIAEVHGGWVRVHSEPRVGSTFSLVLPRALPSPESVQAGDDQAARTIVTD